MNLASFPQKINNAIYQRYPVSLTRFAKPQRMQKVLDTNTDNVILLECRNGIIGYYHNEKQTCCPNVKLQTHT